MLADLFRYPLEQGYQMACEVDKGGKAIGSTTTKEHAELKSPPDSRFWQGCPPGPLQGFYESQHRASAGGFVAGRASPLANGGALHRGDVNAGKAPVPLVPQIPKIPQVRHIFSR